MRIRHLSPLLLPLVTLGALGAPAIASEVPDSEPTEVMLRMLLDAEEQPPEAPQHLTPCEDGMAGGYPCEKIDLLEFLPKSGMGNPSSLNDIWGWTDTGSGREFALVGLRTGTAFVEITDPENVVWLGNLPTHTSDSTWRDIKTYANHAFIVSEASGHGMQVFDLTQLLSVASPPVTFSETAHYPGFGNAHNIVIDEDTGFAFAVGTGTCSGGLHMVNIQTPSTPTHAGCFSADGYTHDAQCVVYSGPDADHQGSEICFNSNEDTVTIVDVTNKAAPVQISRTLYPGTGYTHQNWLTEDQEHLLVDDELDEQSFGHNTYTYVWDVRDLDAPLLLGHFASPTAAIDHNPDFQIGRAEVVFEGSDIAILTYGVLFREAWLASRMLRAEGISVRLLNLRTLKPVDAEAILLAAQDTDLLVTVEDHFLTGGLFSIVSELLVRYRVAADVLPLALSERWFQPGLLADVLSYEGFDAGKLADKIMARWHRRN